MFVDQPYFLTDLLDIFWDVLSPFIINFNKPWHFKNLSFKWHNNLVSSFCAPRLLKWFWILKTSYMFILAGLLFMCIMYLLNLRTVVLRFYLVSKSPWSSRMLVKCKSKISTTKEKVLCWVQNLAFLQVTIRFRWASLVAQSVKNVPAMQEIRIRSLGWEDPLEKANGNPLQYSCLEKSMDRGASWATVHGIAKSRTRLSD